MKKESDMPRDAFFQVPPGYFERLPLRIQQRLEEQQPHPRIRPAWRIALACAVVILGFLAGLKLSTIKEPNTPESILTDVATADLILYLEESGITTDEVVEEAGLSADDINALEDAVFELHPSGLSGGPQH